MPTAATFTYGEDILQPAFRPELAVHLSVRLAASTTYPKGCALGEIAATPGIFAPYDDTASDGTEMALGLLPFACTTDSAGLITKGNVSTGDPLGIKSQTVAIYVGGYFRTADLPQTGAGALDADGAANLGKLVQGTLADGILRVI